MSFSQWMFGGFDNPVVDGHWGPLHIVTLILCVVLILAGYLFSKHAADPLKMRSRIIYVLAGITAFFEVMIRVVYAVKLYFFHYPEMNGLNALWIIVPKPWCDIACWLIVACVFVRKPYFYNFASLSAMLCAVIYFAYPGTGFHNQYVTFENLNSIVTHAVLLITSVLLIVFGFTDFRYRDFWKLGTCFIATYLYGFLQIYILKTHVDPMYFMPDGDIQGILGIGYVLYLVIYIAFIILYVNVFHLIQDRATVKAFFGKVKAGNE